MKSIRFGNRTEREMQVVILDCDDKVPSSGSSLGAVVSVVVVVVVFVVVVLAVVVAADVVAAVVVTAVLGLATLIFAFKTHLLATSSDDKIHL